MKMKTAEELGNLSQGELVAMVLELQEEVAKKEKSSDTWYKHYNEANDKYDNLVELLKNLSKVL